MGTDIHCVWQKKNKDNSWTDIQANYDEDRHYYLFAWLADVRNGFGFAGVRTHEPLVPIAEPRGLPADFQVDEDYYHTASRETYPKWRLDYHEKGEPYNVWLGEHSHSWLTWDEILLAEQPKDNIKTGIITIAEFKEWDKKTPPESYCGGISGHSIVVAENINSITPATTHVRVQWIDNSCLQYFIDIVQALKNEHGKGRLVFGFDS
jgi:hypothetical protein